MFLSDFSDSERILEISEIWTQVDFEPANRKFIYLEVRCATTRLRDHDRLRNSEVLIACNLLTQHITIVSTLPETLNAPKSVLPGAPTLTLTDNINIQP